MVIVLTFFTVLIWLVLFSGICLGIFYLFILICKIIPPTAWIIIIALAILITYEAVYVR